MTRSSGFRFEPRSVAARRRGNYSIPTCHNGWHGCNDITSTSENRLDTPHADRDATISETVVHLLSAAATLNKFRAPQLAMKSARADRSASSFEVVAREWFAKYSASWAANHGDRIIRRFERDIFPWIGGRPITNVTAPELLAVVRRIENRGALETAHRALGNCGQVFRYAVRPDGQCAIPAATCAARCPR